MRAVRGLHGSASSLEPWKTTWRFLEEVFDSEKKLTDLDSELCKASDELQRMKVRKA